MSRIAAIGFAIPALLMGYFLTSSAYHQLPTTQLSRLMLQQISTQNLANTTVVFSPTINAPPLLLPSAPPQTVINASAITVPTAPVPTILAQPSWEYTYAFPIIAYC